MVIFIFSIIATNFSRQSHPLRYISVSGSSKYTHDTAMTLWDS